MWPELRSFMFFLVTFLKSSPVSLKHHSASIPPYLDNVEQPNMALKR